MNSFYIAFVISIIIISIVKGPLQREFYLMSISWISVHSVPIITFCNSNFPKIRGDIPLFSVDDKKETEDQFVAGVSTTPPNNLSPVSMTPAGQFVFSIVDTDKEPYTLRLRISPRILEKLQLSKPHNTIRSDTMYVY